MPWNQRKVWYFGEKESKMRKMHFIYKQEDRVWQK